MQSLTGRDHVLFPGRAAAGIAAALTARGLRDRWVILPANICYIAAWAVQASGNRPFLADIDPTTSSLSIETLNAVPLDDIGALIACHMYGLAAPIHAIADWARSHDIFLIEDAALALGAHADSQPVGSWGDVSLFSFGSGKIADVGNGGALLTNDSALASEITRELDRQPEWSPRVEELEHQWLQIYWALHQFETANPKLPDLYPALHAIYSEIVRYHLPDYPFTDLADALENLPANLSHRKKIAAIYQEALSGLSTLIAPPGSIYWRYPLLIPANRRDDLLHHLWSEGFHEITRWYPSLRYMLSTLVDGPCFEATPGADQFGAEIINLPVADGIDVDTARWLARTIRRYFDNGWRNGIARL